ncbi:MAG: hypothetical protein BWX55_01840 [Deltaproteobacteria bacterium ADurb.Bin022]|nr:MAG: hypothetical protein BWX55_01840 [Deltaproteobacteria bacterium ADurb.Bin022]
MDLFYVAGKGHAVRQQKAAGIRIVTCPDGNPCKKRDDGSLYGILQEDGCVKLLFPEHPGEPEYAGGRVIFVFIDDDFIEVGKNVINIRHPRLDEHGNPGLRISGAYGGYGRQGQYCISDPVGAANQNFMDAFLGQFFDFFVFQRTPFIPFSSRPGSCVR